LVDGIGSLMQLRVYKGLKNILLNALKDEERKWRVNDLERLFQSYTGVPMQFGDIFEIVLKSEGRIREFENWESQVRDSKKMLDNML